MIKIFKYLKKSIVALLAVVVLLAIQAVSDLSLPDYTSKIVNVGIQQGGVEHAAPEVIRKTEMDKVLLLVDEETKNKVLNNYTLLDKESLNSTDYEGYSKDYPALADQELYKLNNVDEATLDDLNKVMAGAILLVANAESGSAESVAMTQQLAAAFPAGALPANAGFFDILKLMPQESRAKVIEQMNSKISAMPESITQQSAVSFVKNEYNTIGMDTDKMQTNYILWAGLKMLGLALVSVMASILVTLLAARIAARLGMDLRHRVFNKVVGFSNKEFDQFSTASLITRSTNDIQQVQLLMAIMLRMVIYAPILGVGGFIKVLHSDSSMAWIIGVAVLAILVLVAFLFVVAMPKFRALQKLVDKLNLVSREILTGLSVIRAFSTEKYEEKRFAGVNEELTRTNLFVNRVMTVMMPTMMFIMNGIGVLIVWVGAGNVDNGAMQVGDLMAFIQYTMMIVMSFLMISFLSIMLPRASVSAKRIAEVLDTKTEIADPKISQAFDSGRKGYLEFRDVSFRYPNAEENVLSDISFVAKPGETTAIIGSTGSGKSTLINLIPRFFDATSGEVLVDGVNVKNVSQHELRDKLGFVPQKGVLFSGTIETNIRYGREDASDADVAKAARIAQAAEFIENKTDKYQSEVSQGGNNVSGGQKQRLSIARAIAKNPEIYIFDDSFSALDYRTDVALRQALKEELRESTVLIVAQRISTILHAEQIIVLEEGKIVGKGTHKELMENCEVYSQIALSQLSKEELAHE